MSTHGSSACPASTTSLSSSTRPPTSSSTLPAATTSKWPSYAYWKAGAVGMFLHCDNIIASPQIVLLLFSSFPCQQLSWGKCYWRSGGEEANFGPHYSHYHQEKNSQYWGIVRNARHEALVCQTQCYFFCQYNTVHCRASRLEIGRDPWSTFLGFV